MKLILCVLILLVLSLLAWVWFLYRRIHRLQTESAARPRPESEALPEKTAPEPAVPSPRDEAFMKKFNELMEKELDNSELNITRIAESMHISRTKFYYTFKELTGENPSTFFMRYKLNRAAELLKEDRYTMSEIARMTGFSNLSHFSTSFKKQFGVPPTGYAR